MQFATIVGAALLLLPLVGCGHRHQPPHAAGAYEVAGPIRDYRLGPGDHVRVTVYRETQLSGRFVVDTAGNIGVPTLGQVKAAGQTVRQLETKIESLLGRDLVQDPRVSVDIAQYRPFYITGEVRRAGAYPYAAALTVQDAVALAGGYTYRANERYVYVMRAYSDFEEEVPLVGRAWVYPGDNVRIAERRW